MSRPRGINQKSIHLKLDNDLVPVLEDYAREFHQSKNKSINKLLRYMLEK